MDHGALHLANQVKTKRQTCSWMSLIHVYISKISWKNDWIKLIVLHYWDYLSCRLSGCYSLDCVAVRKVKLPNPTCSPSPSLLLPQVSVTSQVLLPIAHSQVILVLLQALVARLPGTSNSFVQESFLPPAHQPLEMRVLCESSLPCSPALESRGLISVSQCQFWMLVSPSSSSNILLALTFTFHLPCCLSCLRRSFTCIATCLCSSCTSSPSSCRSRPPSLTLWLAGSCPRSSLLYPLRVEAALLLEIEIIKIAATKVKRFISITELFGTVQNGGLSPV